MGQQAGPGKEPAEQVTKEIRRATRRQFSALVAARCRSAAPGPLRRLQWHARRQLRAALLRRERRAPQSRRRSLTPNLATVPAAAPRWEKPDTLPEHQLRELVNPKLGVWEKMG